MIKIVLVILLALFSTFANAEEKRKNKFAYYQYNKYIIITISNIPCPFDNINQVYKYSSLTKRLDGTVMTGCFRPYDDNNLEIYWTSNERMVINSANFGITPLKFEKIEKEQPKVEM